MSITIDDLVRSYTAAEINEQFLSILETIKIPARSWRDGGTAKSILMTVATTYSGFTLVMSAVIKGGFLETAEGDFLTLLARYVYGVERREATFATGEITLINSGGGVYAWVADEVRVTWEAGKKDYVNTTAWSISGGETIVKPFRAAEAGSASSAPPSSITKLQTSMLGVTVTNVSAFIGSDAESDAELRARCLAKLGSLSPNGPRSAYEYAVKSALRLDGSPVDINRVTVSPYSSTGVVDIYCASPSGTPIVTDLEAAAANVEAVACPDSVTANTLAAVPVALAATLTVWARQTAGVSSSALELLVQTALAAMVREYPIGGIAKPPSTQGYLYGNNIDGAAKSAHASIFDVDGADADRALAPGEVATLATAITVRLVP